METKDINGNINCVGCEDCRNCIDCVNCKGCYNCVGSKNLRGCNNCVECKNCDNCSYCNLANGETNAYYIDNSVEESSELTTMSSVVGMEMKSCKIELKDIDTVKGIVQFYAGTYGKDETNDIITKEAYDKTLSENKGRIKHFYNHDQTKVPGVIQEIANETKGLLCTSKLMPTTLGKDTLIEYEHKAITEHSQGYQPVEGRIEHKDGVRTIKELKLWEVSSLSHWGANKNTPMVSLKNKSFGDIMHQVNAFGTILRKSNISDERGLEIEKELQLLQTYLKSLRTPGNPPSTPTTKGFDWSKINEKLT